MSDRALVDEENLAALEQALRQCVSRLALLALDGHSDLEAEIDDLRNEARSGTDAQRLKALSASLGRRAMATFPAPGAKTSAEQTPDTSWLIRLLKRINVDNDATLNTLLARTSSIQREVELELVLDDLAAHLGQARPARGKSADSQLRSLIGDLLRQLNLPEKQRAVADLLLRDIDSLQTELQVPKTLNRIADIIASLRNELMIERLSNERFLAQLTDNLQRIEQSVQRMQGSNQETIAGSRKLNADVHDEVNLMRDDVANSDSVDHIKSFIAKRIDTIRSRVENYRQEEETRSAKLEREVEELNHRLHGMEEESQALQKKMQRARHQAKHDTLTGIPNRLAYDERAALEHARWKRYRNPLSIAVVDVDHFKCINDKYGHQAGDKALRTLATMLQRQVRETDFVARFGGEEFVLLMPDTALADAMLAANHLREAIAASDFNYQGNPVKLTVSVGVTDFRDNDRPRKAFERADMALHDAKNAGRNTCISK